jgi:hypothetical protein
MVAQEQLHLLAAFRGSILSHIARIRRKNLLFAFWLPFDLGYTAAQPAYGLMLLDCTLAANVTLVTAR